MNLREIGMMQRGERLVFAGESREAISVVREGFRQDLDRHVAIQLRVAGAEDLAHAAFAEQGRDLVDAESRARSQRQVADYKGGTAARAGLPLGDGAPGG